MNPDRPLSLPEIHAMLRDRAGLDPEAIGTRSIAFAVQKRMPLRPDDGQFQELLDELLVPETWFFRDVQPYRVLRDYARPWSARPAAPVFRALSVACSTGEEAYSIAMVLSDAGLGPSRFAVHGVDLSRRALRSAERAAYGPRSFREEDPALAELGDRCCLPSDGHRVVREELRREVSFIWQNLAAADFLADAGPFQVVFCRNVLIYFHAQARRTALDHLARLLAPGGLLICGHAEARIFAEPRFRPACPEYPLAFTCGPVPPASVPLPPARPAQRPPSPPAVARPRVPPPKAADSALSPPPPVKLDLHLALQAAQQAADAGRLSDAQTLCRQVLAAHPANAHGHYLLGIVSQAQGADEEACRLYTKTLYLDPRHYQAIVHLMLLAEQRGETAMAENYRRRAELCRPAEEK